MKSVKILFKFADIPHRSLCCVGILYQIFEHSGLTKAIVNNDENECPIFHFFRPKYLTHWPPWGGLNDLKNECTNNSPIHLGI